MTFQGRVHLFTNVQCLIHLYTYTIRYKTKMPQTTRDVFRSTT